MTRRVVYPKYGLNQPLNDQGHHEMLVPSYPDGNPNNKFLFIGYISNYIGDKSRTGGIHRIDITGGVMAGYTTTIADIMGRQDICPGGYRMTIGARLGVCLAKIASPTQNQMILAYPWDTMGVAIIIGGMAGNALTASGNCRTLDYSIGGSIMTGCTTLWFMNLTTTNKGCGGSRMTAYTIICGQGI